MIPILFFFEKRIIFYLLDSFSSSALIASLKQPLKVRFKPPCSPIRCLILPSYYQDLSRSSRRSIFKDLITSLQEQGIIKERKGLGIAKPIYITREHQTGGYSSQLSQDCTNKYLFIFLSCICPSVSKLYRSLLIYLLH